MLTNDTINKIVKHIRKKADPKAIYLFGSYAYGVPNENSDIDFLIIKDDFQNKREEIYKIKKDIISKDYSIDLLIYTEQEYQKKIKEGWQVITDIVKKGKKIYAK